MSVKRGHKVCLVGNSGVGKSSIFHRLVRDTFTEKVTLTIAAAYFEKELSVNGETVRMCIWDTAGAERFRSLTPLFYRGTDGIVLVYDITDERSFHNLRTEWIPSIRASADTNMALVVVGNKLDLEETGRVVPAVEARGYADLLNAIFFETSAKTGENVERIFTELALKIRETKPTYEEYERRVVQIPGPSLNSDENIPDPSNHRHDRSKCTC
ncbi:ras-related protein Rab-22A-like [Patiria miniata]|uniref:Uncharacterized protein n=1 Tax=Patiria miniata TaxID=46514 RepID=A0A914B4D9_PATMI|nr:ras-related protein Rab-22A-like [Patiria miniata]